MDGRTNAISGSAPTPEAPYDESYAGNYTTTTSNPSIRVPSKPGKIYTITASTFNGWQVYDLGITGATIKKQNRFNMGTSGQGSGMRIISAIVEATSNSMVITPKSTYPTAGTTGTFTYLVLSVL